MANKSKIALKDEIQTNLPTNDNHEITAQATRKVLEDMVDSLDSGSALSVRDYGAAGDGITDDTAAIQAAIDAAYQHKKAVKIPAGIYRVTRTLWVYDGIEIRGDGIYNTIVQTPFGTDATAKAYAIRDKNQQYSTLSNPSQVPTLDIAHGHNRFYIGGGIVGYYDSDRATNPDHPLYWPNDGSAEWTAWKSELDIIEQRGSWIGLTGRENYGGAVFKSMQVPGLVYPSGYSHVHPYGPIWTGIRNVKFCDFQINTNGVDRGKDSAIDFQYKATAIPSGTLRETYDSSVLNVQLYNMYLFSLGRSGYRGTRCVDHTFIGCYVRQCAGQGFYIDGVTSCFWSGCYTNSCVEGGYVLRGCNYSNLSACASDSCPIGYNIYNCKGITLNGCGAEATRYQPAGEDETEDPLKGRGFCIQNSDGISLVSCYAMTSHPKVYDDVLEATDEDIKPEWNRSRHVYVNNSQNVQVSYCHFKAFERARTAAFRNAANQKCNYQGGPYDPTQPGSRYWQIQNYLVGAQYEIRAEESSVQIISSEKEESLRKLSEIRTGNLDILDPGTVPNPAAGYNTAGKTLSGDDGNGGWIYTDPDTQQTSRVAMENFEFAFPINAERQYGSRDYFWAWRNSLILVRKHDDTSLQTSHPTRYYGYLDVIGSTPINWAQVSSSDMAKFSLDVVSDYEEPSFIDGSKSLFTYGRLFWESLTPPIAYAPKIYTPIPALVRDKPDGHRTALNTNTVDGLPTEAAKAAVMIVGNANREATEDTEAVIAGMVMSAVSRRTDADTDEDTVHSKFTNLANRDILTIYEQGKLLSTRGHRIISTSSNDYSPIPLLASNADNTAIIVKINTLIDRITAHGLAVNAPPVSFSVPTIDSVNASSDGVQNHLSVYLGEIIQNEGVTVYKKGVAYSSTNQTPTHAQNYMEFINDIAEVPFGSSTTKRYIRFYVETSATPTESDRIYSDAYEVNLDRTHLTATIEAL